MDCSFLHLRMTVRIAQVKVGIAQNPDRGPAGSPPSSCWPAELPRMGDGAGQRESCVPRPILFARW
jgi:hypothetical protein